MASARGPELEQAGKYIVEIIIAKVLAECAP